MNGRKLTGLAAMLSAAIMGGVVSMPVAALEKVNFYAVRDPQNSSQLAVAERLGYFKEAGIEVDLHWVTSFSDLYAPAGAGQIDFTVSSVNNGLKWHQDGIPMKYMSILTNIAGGQGVAVNPDAVKKPSDFGHIKVGMATGSTVELALRNFAKSHGIDYGKIQFVNLQPPDQLAALSSNQVQAIAVWQPWLHRATTEFGAKMYFTGTHSYIPGEEGRVPWLVLPSGVLANTTLLKNRPDAAKGVLSALLKAEKFLNEHQGEAATLIASDMKVPPEVLQSMLPTLDYSATLDDSVTDAINTIEDFLMRTKKLKARVAPRDLFDVELLGSVAPELVKIQ